MVHAVAPEKIGCGSHVPREIPVPEGCGPYDGVFADGKLAAVHLRACVWSGTVGGVAYCLPLARGNGHGDGIIVYAGSDAEGRKLGYALIALAVWGSRGWIGVVVAVVRAVPAVALAGLHAPGGELVYELSVGVEKKQRLACGAYAEIKLEIFFLSLVGAARSVKQQILPRLYGYIRKYPLCGVLRVVGNAVAPQVHGAARGVVYFHPVGSHAARGAAELAYVHPPKGQPVGGVECGVACARIGVAGAGLGIGLELAGAVGYARHGDVSLLVLEGIAVDYPSGPVGNHHVLPIGAKAEGRVQLPVLHSLVSGAEYHQVALGGYGGPIREPVLHGLGQVIRYAEAGYVHVRIR